MVNKPLIRPYLLDGVALGGVARIPLIKGVTNCLPSRMILQESPIREMKNLGRLAVIQATSKHKVGMDSTFFSLLKWCSDLKCEMIYKIYKCGFQG